jgi:hypothetical protein
MDGLESRRPSLCLIGRGHADVQRCAIINDQAHELRLTKALLISGGRHLQRKNISANYEPIDGAETVISVLHTSSMRCSTSGRSRQSPPTGCPHHSAQTPHIERCAAAECSS